QYGYARAREVLAEFSELEACPPAQLFSRKEWLEDSRLNGCIHAISRIGNRDHDVGSGCAGDVLIGIGLVQIDIMGFDSELASLRHRIARVDGQVHEDLLNLAGVRFDRPDIRIQRRDEYNILINDAAEYL